MFTADSEVVNPAQVEKQQRLNPKKAHEEPYKPLAPVLDNSAIWGSFMGVSTNLRYQLVNCIEDRGLVGRSFMSSSSHSHQIEKQGWDRAQQ